MEKGLDTDEIRNFYERIPSVWPKDDMWHIYSRNQIHKYIQKQSFDPSCYILNAGSGGSDYGLPYRMQHVDIAKNKIDFLPEYTVASLESLPFGTETFSDAICVGSVVNYCDAMAAIHELSRVLKQSGTLIIEFESSWGFEHTRSPAYKKAAEIVTLPYCGQQHSQWLYSYDYIQSILKVEGFVLLDEFRFHYLSGLFLSQNHDENKATSLAKYDIFCRKVPLLCEHSNNIILLCRKS